MFEYIIEEESTLKSYNCMVLIASWVEINFSFSLSFSFFLKKGGLQSIITKTCHKLTVYINTFLHTNFRIVLVILWQKTLIGLLIFRWMIASLLTPGTDMDLLVRHRVLKLRLCTKLKTYFDFPTFYWLSKLPRKAPHKVPPIKKYQPAIFAPQLI